MSEARPTPTTTLRRTTVHSPIGSLVVEADDEALVAVELPPPGPRRRGAAASGAPASPMVGGDGSARGRPAVLEEATRQLGEYFAGRRRRFDLPLRLSGTEFQRAVWRSLGEIPYGTVVSYAELAAMVGRPRAWRAVGRANGSNPLPVVLPCHRVVASSRRIGGYGGGLVMKRQLLALEGVAGL
jgi:methylated-DNA-[protein]-cysteine S-methyltransferase